MTRSIRSSLSLAMAASVALAILSAGCSKDPEVAKREYVKSGDRYVEQQKYREAIVQYRNALQQDPKFGEARLKLAQALERAGNPRETLREYVRAADALPDDVPTQLKAAGYLLEAGQFEDARTRVEHALRKDPNSAEGQLILGAALAGLRDFEGAVREIEEALALDPSSVSALTALGSVQLARGNRPDAEQAFRRAVEVHPRLPAAHLALANYLWASGRPADAEASLATALELEPGNVLALRALAAFRIAGGRPAEAEPQLKALADADTTPTAVFKIGLADYYVAMRRPDDAERVLRPLASEKRTFAAARTREALIAYGRAGAADGHRLVDEVLEREPKHLHARLVKATFLQAEGKVDEALPHALKAVELEPRAIQGHYLLGRLKRAKGLRDEAIASFAEVLKLNPRAAAAQVQLAELNLAKGEPGAAVQFAKEAARAQPNDPGVQLVLVRTLLANGNVDEAEQQVRTLQQQHGGAAAVHVAAGQVQLRKRDVGGARRAFARAYELDGDSVPALEGLITTDFAEKKTDAARARMAAHLAKGTPSPAAQLLSARVLAAVGDAEASEQTLRAVIEREPSNLQAYGMLASLYGRQRRLGEARAAYEEILRTQSESVPVHTIVAIIDGLEGRHADARARYERILQIDRTAPVAANNLAYIYAEEGGNLDIALQLAQAAKAKLPEVPEVDDTLGWVFVKRNLPTAAIPHLEAAVRSDPANPTFRYHLGVALARVGEKTRARLTLEQVVRASPDSPEASDALKLLETL